MVPSPFGAKVRVIVTDPFWPWRMTSRATWPYLVGALDKRPAVMFTERHQNGTVGGCPDCGWD